MTECEIMEIKTSRITLCQIFLIIKLINVASTANRKL